MMNSPPDRLRLARCAGPKSGAAKTDATGASLLPLTVSHLIGEPVTVIDFGAGPAVGLIDILAQVRGLDLATFRYILVETPALCRAIEKPLREILMHRHGSSDFVEILDSIPSVMRASRSIISAGSALQYISDYRATLSRLLALVPDHLIISQTPVSDHPTYARQQLNVPRATIASWVFNRRDLIADVETLGYRLVFAADHDLPLTHKNAPAPSVMASMVFSRSASKRRD